MAPLSDLPKISGPPSQRLAKNKWPPPQNRVEKCVEKWVSRAFSNFFAPKISCPHSQQLAKNKWPPPLSDLPKISGPLPKISGPLPPINNERSLTSICTFLYNFAPFYLIYHFFFLNCTHYAYMYIRVLQ